MSRIQEENLAVRMILARDAQVLIEISIVIFQGFNGIKREQFKICEKLIILLAKRAGPVLRNVTIISLARL